MSIQKILNVWNSKVNELVYYTLPDNQIVFELEDYKIIRHNGAFLYTYKNISVNQLAGLNKEHLTALYNNKKPIDSQSGFLFDRAKENINKGLNLITDNK